MECQKIEIVGVAGTGKSTLARTLADRDPGNRIADSLHTRTSAHWAYVAHSAPRVLPLVARSARVRPAFDWEETKFIVYVTEWRRFLRRACRDDSGLVVLDQGPIFALARLLWGRKPVTATPEFEHWLDEQVAGWSVDLDGIVWLVAPEEVLLGRINEREQDHEAKGRSIREGLDVLLAHQMRLRGALRKARGARKAAGLHVRHQRDVTGSDRRGNRGRSGTRPEPATRERGAITMKVGPACKCTTPQDPACDFPSGRDQLSVQRALLARQGRARPVHLHILRTEAASPRRDRGVLRGRNSSRILPRYRLRGTRIDPTTSSMLTPHRRQCSSCSGLIRQPRRRELFRSLVYTVHDSFYDYKLRDKIFMLPIFATFRRTVFCGRAAHESYPALWRAVLRGRGRVVPNAADLDRVRTAVSGDGSPQRSVRDRVGGPPRAGEGSAGAPGRVSRGGRRIHPLAFHRRGHPRASAQARASCFRARRSRRADRVDSTRRGVRSVRRGRPLRLPFTR